MSTRLDTALRIYDLAQKYGLRLEALQTARVILLKQSMTIEDLDDKLDIMSGASLYELWKYSERVRAILASDLTKFMASDDRGTIAGLRCTWFSSWLDHYIKSIANTPKLFDPSEFNTARARFIKDCGNGPSCVCASIPSQTIHEFWEALTFIIDGSFEKVSMVNILGCLGF